MVLAPVHTAVAVAEAVTGNMAFTVIVIVAVAEHPSDVPVTV